MNMKKRISKLVGRLNATDDGLFDSVKKQYPNAVLNLSGGRYLYIDNGSNILAVAHVDTVEGYPKPYYSRIDKKQVKFDTKPAPTVKKMTVTSIMLDDRLGVHLILDILPMMGITTDILLTDDEEWAQSSAYYFVPPKDKVYNWAFSFDRRGVGECVMYQYDDNKQAVERVLDAGWYFGHGTYSDIADLEIGCTCFNFSAGYINEHTDACFCQYDAVMYNAQLFKKFYLDNKDVYMPFEKKANVSKYNSEWWKGNRYGGKYTYTKQDETIAIVPTSSSANEYAKYDHIYGQVCVVCGRHATTWDVDGSPICDNCAFDLYDMDKECDYCGMPIHDRDDVHGKGEEEDDLYEGICVSCATWLRENMSETELECINIKHTKNEPI